MKKKWRESEKNKRIENGDCIWEKVRQKERKKESKTESKTERKTERK